LVGHPLQRTKQIIDYLRIVSSFEGGIISAASQ